MRLHLNKEMVFACTWPHFAAVSLEKHDGPHLYLAHILLLNL